MSATNPSVPRADAEDERPADELVPVPLIGKLATLVAVLVPLVGVGAAVVLLWGRWVSWADLTLLAGFYLLTAVGITVGFHRLFVHRSFETYLPVKLTLAALGSMAVQGSLFNWVAQHRRHHQHSDTAEDPHSPHRYGRGLWGRVRGLYHSHIGWAFRPERPGLARYVADLRKSWALRLASRLFLFWVALGLALPAVLGGLLTGSWVGVWTGLVWGGLVRLFLVHHVTWSVNSVGHIWGTRPYKSDDQSRNNFVVGVLALGEGWHNTHHAFPTSARHGLRWWQPDLSYYLIRLLALLGLAWNVKLPTREVQAEARRRA
jgi:stearoyl-CoA desaturase (delta-9 desaturase)